MPISTKIFRVFVSSTFSDLVVERDALQSKVYPRLAALCKAHGASFQAVDLRWGVSEQAAEDQRTMRICLGEIDRCREQTPYPNFILLMGDRYGWQPIPELIPVECGELVDNDADACYSFSATSSLASVVARPLKASSLGSVNRTLS